jgi:cytoskeletal protein CcmA (bactofilin family)
VKGNLSVNSVTLHGHVNGNITAKDRIQFKATANMNGDIRGKRLSVEDGVTFVGKSEVNPSGSPQRPASGGETAPAPQPAEAAAAGDRDSDAKQDGRSRPAMFGKR